MVRFWVEGSPLRCCEWVGVPWSVAVVVLYYICSSLVPLVRLTGYDVKGRAIT